MKEAIILAGGRGTRLSSITRGGQKVVVKIGEQTFIEYLLKRLQRGGFNRIYIAVGYRSEEVEKVIARLELDIDFKIIHENKPLGTGGAIKNAMQQVNSEEILVLNGDSYNDFDYGILLSNHQKSKADISVLTKRVENVARYGEVRVSQNGRVLEFLEKTGIKKSGIINLGVYGIKTTIFENFKSKRFSMEQFLTDHVGSFNIFSIPSTGEFIDIGTPDDYQKFKQKFTD